MTVFSFEIVFFKLIFKFTIKRLIRGIKNCIYFVNILTAL